MTMAFASSMLNSEKTGETDFQNIASSDELVSFFSKKTIFSPFEKENVAFQKNENLIFASDTFVVGRHFDLEDRPQDIARCMLRTSLSNMAACGTHIKGYLMALSLPQDLDPTWLEIFKATLIEEQNYFQLCALGGDINVTSGPLMLTFTFVGVRHIRPKIQAQLGDRIYVTGCLGDREMGHFLSQFSSAEVQKKLLEDDVEYLRIRYLLPDPHINLVQRLLPYINTCLSFSEGLIKDLTHLCSSSYLQAYIDLKSIPRSAALQRVAQKMDLDLSDYGFTKGEDRELLFTAPLGEEDQILYLSHAFNLNTTPIGYMGLRHNMEDKAYVSWLDHDLSHT
ncbi:MAG: thiamine-phosphate kinase [Janthinobacterium lividum]